MTYDERCELQNQFENCLEELGAELGCYFSWEEDEKERGTLKVSYPTPTTNSSNQILSQKVINTINTVIKLFEK